MGKPGTRYGVSLRSEYIGPVEGTAKNGVESEMGDIFDEGEIMALAPEKLTGVIQTPQSIGPAV